MFAQLLMSPWIAAMLLAVLGIEALILLLVWKRAGVGLPPIQIVSFLGAGAAFAFALGFALHGNAPIGMAVSLFCAFLCHLTDLLLRWQKQS